MFDISHTERLTTTNPSGVKRKEIISTSYKFSEYVPVWAWSRAHCYVCRVDLINDLRAFHIHPYPSTRPPIHPSSHQRQQHPHRHAHRLPQSRSCVSHQISIGPGSGCFCPGCVGFVFCFWFLSTTAGNCDKLIELNGKNIRHQIACDDKRVSLPIEMDWKSEWIGVLVSEWKDMSASMSLSPGSPRNMQAKQKLTHFQRDMFYMSVSSVFARRQQKH